MAIDSDVVTSMAKAIWEVMAEHPFDPSVQFSGPSAAQVIEAVLGALPGTQASFEKGG